MTPKFTVSILAYGRLELTTKCVDAVLKHSSDAEFILTDNHSQDGTLEFFRRTQAAHPDRVRVVANPDNLGFQIPNTNALNMARGEYLVLLNNDTVVPQGWLQTLYAPFVGNPKMAITGAAGGCSMLHPSFHGHVGPHVEYVEGSCLMVRCELARKHGLFAPYIRFIYGDDSDLSLRMRELGYTIKTVPLNIQHQPNSTCKHMPWIKQIQEENHVALRKRWAHYLKVRRMDYPILVRRDIAMGDVLLATPVILALREQRPLCKIMVETKSPDVVANIPGVSAGQRMPVDGSTLVIDLNMAYENRTETNIVQCYVDVAGIQVIDRHLYFQPHDQDKEWAKSITSQLDGKPICAIFPGPTNWIGKNWDFNRWKAVIDWLRRSWHVILVGAQRDVSMPHSLDMRGKTSVSKLGALLGRCQLFVGLDSFPMHLARAMSVPAVVLFGATSPEYVLSDGPPVIPVQGDRNKVPCIGERHRVKGSTYVPCKGACMMEIGVDDVMNAVTSMVGVV